MTACTACCRKRAAAAGCWSCTGRCCAALAELQMQATPRMRTCHYLKNRSFGYEALRWETDYFTECFLKGYCGIEIEQESELDQELHSLADVIAAEPRYFMHRDFQSKNIHFKDGRVRIIDFQTATCGLLQYDLASLLKDAYAPLEPAERQELLGFYLQELAGRWGLAPDPAAFTSMFHRAGLQRTMQALGAFAFLSMRKGKPEFARYIPAGLAALQEALALFPEYPVLGGLSGTGRSRLAEYTRYAISMYSDADRVSAHDVQLSCLSSSSQVV